MSTERNGGLAVPHSTEFVPSSQPEDNTYSVDQPTRCESDMPLQQTKATKYPK